MPDVRLKKRLDMNTILVAPAAFDMVSAKVIERAGFEAVYLSGFGQSASHLGLPDAGLMTLSEIVERVHNMARAIHVPLLADGDTGYGGVINVRRTVQEFEWAGASAIQLEDQEIPKKCGHTEGKRLIDARAMALKIEAAVASRRSDDFLIIARTDARSILGFEEAIRRGKIYEEAGADVIFKPAMANMVEGGKTPLLTATELNEMGFKLVAFAVSCLLAATKAIQRAMQVLKEEGSTQAIVSEMMNFGDFNDLIGFPEVRSFEAKYRT